MSVPSPVAGDVALKVATLDGETRFDSLETEVEGTRRAFRRQVPTEIIGNGFLDAQVRVVGAFGRRARHIREIQSGTEL